MRNSVHSKHYLPELDMERVNQELDQKELTQTKMESVQTSVKNDLAAHLPKV